MTLVLGFLGWTALTAGLVAWHLKAGQRHLQAVERRLAHLDADGAARDLHAAQGDLRAAARESGSPAWRLLGHLPVLGRSAQLVTGLADAGRTLADRVLPGALAAGVDLQPARLRPQPDRLDLSAVSAARDALAGSDAAAADVVARVDTLRPAGVGLLDRRAATAKTTLEAAAGRMHGLAVALRVLPGLLGADGPRRYFVVFQNNAEIRGTGGLPGSFGVLSAAGGRVTLERVGSDGDIHAPNPVAADLGQDFTDRYTALGAFSIFVNANITADFPSAARLFQGYWQQTSGERVDGVIALDPVAESYLLAGAPPLRVPGVPVPLDAGTFVGYVESRIYADFIDVPARKAVLASIARAAFGDVLHASSARSLVDGVTRAAAERRLLVWSDHPDEEKLLETTRVGGAIPRTPGPYLQLALNNAAGSKLDYYVSADVTWTGGGCAGGHRSTVATVVLHNAAPPSGLPPYVTIRADDDPTGRGTGAERLLASLYITPGGSLQDATLDGQPVDVTSEDEAGHPVLTADVTVPPGGSRTLRLQLDEPAAPGVPLVVVPATVPPSTATERLPSCR